MVEENIRIEEQALNNWPALQTMLYDGWVLRFANGYTKRANSVNPIYASTFDLDQKIETCERMYLSQNLIPVFKITPFVQPEHLDDVLEHKGYTRADPTSVQTLQLDIIPEPTIKSVQKDEQVNQEWIDHFCRLSHTDDLHKSTMTQMLSNILTPKCFMSLLFNDQVIACGLGVIEKECLGLYDIVTDAHFRNQGFGEQLLLNLLQWGKNQGATSSCLSVLLHNQPALRLYAKLGYTERYTYWYRVKN